MTVTKAGIGLGEDDRRSFIESLAVVRRELKRMSEVMVKQEGLLNQKQAGLALGVSTKRIGELLRLRKLTPHVFFGRTYVSLREVCDRAEENPNPGRPQRSTVERLVAAAKMIRHTDLAQLRLGAIGGVKADPPVSSQKRKASRR